MSVRRATLVVGPLGYLGLWVLAFNGASSLVEPLLVSLVLVAMVALGVGFTRFMGLPTRKQQFRDPTDGPPS